MGRTTSNPCTYDQNVTTTWKNQLEFIWNILTSRSQWNKSHYICISISWDSIENKFFTIKMKKLVSAVQRIEKSLSKLVFRKKVCQKAILANFCMFYSLWQVCLEAKSSLESKILEIGFNPHTSLTLVQTFTLTLFRTISKAQMHKWGLRGRKYGFI